MIVLTGPVISRKCKLSDKYRFTDDERLMLEAVFTYNQYPKRATLQDLAKKLVVTENKVRNWFVAKRFSLKQKAIQTRQLPRKYLIRYMNMYTLYNKSP